MATGRWYRCDACGHQEPKWPSMFSALQLLTQRKLPACPRCQAEMRLHLNFNLALGATERDVVILASFLPERLSN